VENVKAVPAVSHHADGSGGLGGKGENCRAIGPRKSALPDDEHGLLGFRRCMSASVLRPSTLHPCSDIYK